MRLRSASAALLLLAPRCVVSVLGASSDERWPYNLPAHVKYWPEDEVRVKRDLDSSRDRGFLPSRPEGVRKMSGDEGEKFYLEYWQFGGSIEPQERFLQPPSDQPRQPHLGPQKRTPTVLRPRLMDEDISTEHTNGSLPEPFNPPFLVQTDSQTFLNPHLRRESTLLLRSPRAALKTLQKRDFQCPAGTNSCSAIGRPNSCCAPGETCQIIVDTGLGDVGCCSSGNACSGAVRDCDPGFTGCTGNIGGGCCIPMYVCVSVGCEYLIVHCSLASRG